MAFPCVRFWFSTELAQSPEAQRAACDDERKRLESQKDQEGLKLKEPAVNHPFWNFGGGTLSSENHHLKDETTGLGLGYLQRKGGGVDLVGCMSSWGCKSCVLNTDFVRI